MPVSSPPLSNSSVAISAIFDLNGTPIPVNSGNLMATPVSFVFSLSQPVVLGDGIDFVNWVHDKLYVPLTGDELEQLIEAIPQVPVLGTIRDILLNILHLQVVIQAVQIDTRNKKYFFSITLTESQPVELFAGLAFQSVGIAVGVGGGGTSP
jgi:hypothetical protein